MTLIVAVAMFLCVCGKRGHVCVHVYLRVSYKCSMYTKNTNTHKYIHNNVNIYTYMYVYHVHIYFSMYIYM